MEDRVRALERELTNMQGSLGQVTEAFNNEKLKFMDAVQTEFVNHKLAIEQVIIGAREEFQKMNLAMNDLNEKSESQ